tara:strand:- start:21 stop:266 length:246 start_codon:yes stop_codon:yes gene_type:complete
MQTVCASNFRIPKVKTPAAFKKVRSVQRKRDVQLKNMVDDISKIASQEIERTAELAKELLSDPVDNPIVLEKEAEEDADDQ